MVFLSSDLSFQVFLDQKGYQNCFYPLPETTFALNSSLLRGSSRFFLLKKLELSRVCLIEKIVQDILRNCPLIMAPELLLFPHWTNSNLKEFDLENSAITNAQFNTIISRLSLLEVLVIDDCYKLRRIRISLQRLKRLVLRYCEFENIEIDAPVLSEFVFEHLPNDVKLHVLVLADAILASMFLTYKMGFVDDRVNSFWFLNIREYLIAPFMGITFSLENYRDINKISSDLYELRERVIPPPVEIDCLDLTRFNIKHSFYWEALLDGLLWSCHPKKVCMTMSANSSDVDNCIKTICRMLNQSECLLCCNLSHCECWRRRFKAATIESTGDIVFDEINIKRVTGDLFFKAKCRRVRSRSSIGKSYSNPISCSVTLRFDWEI